MQNGALPMDAQWHSYGQNGDFIPSADGNLIIPNERHSVYCLGRLTTDSNRRYSWSSVFVSEQKLAVLRTKTEFVASSAGPSPRHGKIRDREANDQMAGAIWGMLNHTWFPLKRRFRSRE